MLFKLSKNYCVFKSEQYDKTEKLSYIIFIIFYSTFLKKGSVPFPFNTVCAFAFGYSYIRYAVAGFVVLFGVR